MPCALALLQDLVGRLGRRFLDLLVGDALYLQAPFVKEVERLGLDWAFTLKENQPDLLREAERFTTGPPAAVQSEPKQELRCWHLPQVDWPVADRLVRVVKTVRTDHKRQVTVSQDGDHLTKKQGRGGAGEHQLLRHQFRTRRHPADCSSINSAAVGGASMPRCFRPSPPTATSSIPLSTKARLWWC